MNRLKNLDIWKKSIDLATEINQVTHTFPQEEKYGFISQLRRGAVSISSNIAEGAGRGSDKEFSRSLNIAYGSLYELETQLLILERLGFINLASYKLLVDKVDELQKMIYIFSERLQSSSRLKTHD